MADDQSPKPLLQRAQSAFLEPQTYRLRRLMDGIRILPAVGVLLWMVPLLWSVGPQEAGGSVSMSGAMTYIFVVWFGLICVTFGIWLKTRRSKLETTPPHDISRPMSNGPK